MAEALDFLLDERAAAEIGALRGRLASAGHPVVSDAPSIRFASAASIPHRVRAELALELRRLVLPEVWLAVLGTVLTDEPRLVLAAVADAELLAAHTGVHDALAGRVRHPSANHLPGSWLPHCPLTGRIAETELPAAIAAATPVRPIRAKVVAIVLTDTLGGGHSPLT